MSLTQRLGKHDPNQGLYFLGPYVRDAQRWRPATLGEALKNAYRPELLTMAFRRPDEFLLTLKKRNPVAREGREETR